MSEFESVDPAAEQPEEVQDRPEALNSDLDKSAVPMGLRPAQVNENGHEAFAPEGPKDNSPGNAELNSPSPVGAAEPASQFFDPAATARESTWASAPAADPVPAPLFDSYTRPYIPPPERIPHLGHVALLGLLAFFGALGAILLTRSALYFHLGGISTVKQAVADIRYTLGGQAAFYLLTFGACLVFFPLLWHKGFFEGIQWQASTALRLRFRLFGAAFVCFVLALLNGILLPSPNEAPIDKIIRAPGAPWLLFAFGVTLAPFFEEIAFRGFLLPALCTAADWLNEQSSRQLRMPLDPAGHPQWTRSSMVIASVFTSVPFALMHAEQTGYALGPFLLLVCVSLVLCFARLATRSLAASVLVHAAYNFLLFSLMLVGTQGFRHLEKM
jgi:hypothetical protein